MFPNKFKEKCKIKPRTISTISTRIVWGCIESLNELGERNKLLIGWIPSHGRLEDLEITYQLVKEGVEIPLTLSRKIHLQKSAKKEESTKKVILPGLRQ